VDSACAARECQSVPGKDAVGDAWHATRAGEDAARCALVPPDVRGGERVQGSREIARALDRVRPEPPLFPADPDESAEVEQAERWGDEVLQPVARRVLWNGMRRDRSPLRSYSAGARLGIPIGLAVRTAAPIVALSARFDEPVREDLAALPGCSNRIDDWIAAGAHPAGGLAMRIDPDYPGRMPPVLPASWLEPLATPAAAR
jgi:hypothetical protein